MRLYVEGLKLKSVAASIFALTWLLPLQGRAVEVQNSQLAPVGSYCQLTSLAAAVALTVCSGGIPATAQVVLIEPEGAALRWRDDGTAPTATIGMPISNGGYILYQGNLAALQIIQQATGGIADIAFYKYSP